MTSSSENTGWSSEHVIINNDLHATSVRMYLTTLPIIENTQAVAASIAELGVEYVAIDYAYLSAKLFEEFRRSGLLIGAWTVNNEKDIRRISAMGVDFITSDRPDLLRELLE